MNAMATQSDKVASSFKITKEIFGGAEEDKDKEFSFTVTLEKDGQPYTGDYTIDGKAGTDKDGSFEVSLKGGEKRYHRRSGRRHQVHSHRKRKPRAGRPNRKPFPALPKRTR